MIGDSRAVRSRACAGVKCMAKTIHAGLRALFVIAAVLLWLSHLMTGKPGLTAFLVTTVLFVFITAIFEPRKPAPDKEE